MVEFEILATIEADEIGYELDLRFGEIAVGAVELAEDMAGIDEEDFPGAVAGLFPLVEEPKGAGQGDGEEEIRADGDHDIDIAGADDFFPDVLLGGAGIGGGVGHDESGASRPVQRGVEMLDPEVVAIVGARDAEGIARISGEALLVDLADIEGRVRHHEIEAADGVLQVLVVGIALPDLAAQAVDGEVQPGEPRGVGDALLTVDGDFFGAPPRSGRTG